MPLCRNFPSQWSRSRRRPQPALHRETSLRARACPGNTKCQFAGRLCKPSDGLEPSTPSVPGHGLRREGWNRDAAASVLQASVFRSDATVFRLNASVAGQSGSGSAFRRNTAERMCTIEAAHNPEVAGSNPAPLLRKALGVRAFFVLWLQRPRPNCGPFVARAARGIGDPRRAGRLRGNSTWAAWMYRSVIDACECPGLSWT
jgi:hypothetical protein